MFLLDPSIFFKSQNSLVSDDTASPVTPETSCQGTVPRVTKPSAMESKITGMLLVSWDLVFLSRFNLCVNFTLRIKKGHFPVFANDYYCCCWCLIMLLKPHLQGFCGSFKGLKKCILHIFTHEGLKSS